MVGSVWRHVCLFASRLNSSSWASSGKDFWIAASREKRNTNTHIKFFASRAKMVEKFPLWEQEKYAGHTQIAERRGEWEQAHIYVLLVHVCVAHSKRLLTLRATEHMSVISAFELTPCTKWTWQGRGSLAWVKRKRTVQFALFTLRSFGLSPLELPFGSRCVPESDSDSQSRCL